MGRAFWRAVLAWSPVLVATLVLPPATSLSWLRFRMAPPTSPPWIALAAVIVFFAAGLYAALHPARGLQDRIAGTWLVPR